ncbi:MAG: hypothetical protein RDV48_19685 [Candidatus Eremiobacteraeota bacterium]|nr:hypothetical protein [Candidatus Eremiobacteraeota bacterium]
MDTAIAMLPTVLLYSSHNRCDYLHREFIIDRALRGLRGDRTILHLPVSVKSQRGQRFDYGRFRWYYMHFRGRGLRYYPFYWNEHLRNQDLDIFFKMLHGSQVVVLGGGSSFLGMMRYRAMGMRYCGDGDLFRKVLIARQERGALTVGFSAGADQLGEYLSGIISHSALDACGIGLARDIVTAVHFSQARRRQIQRLARGLPHCLAFGLPNDSGIAISQGFLPSGSFWQTLLFIIDCSWEAPADLHHIKTRQGEKIHHFYSDGRHWAYNGGDMLVRVISKDYRWQKLLLVTNESRFIDYHSQKPSPLQSIQEFLAGL